jgi:hypothetical protein
MSRPFYSQAMVDCCDRGAGSGLSRPCISNVPDMWRLRTARDSDLMIQLIELRQGCFTGRCLGALFTRTLYQSYERMETRPASILPTSSGASAAGRFWVAANLNEEKLVMDGIFTQTHAAGRNQHTLCHKSLCIRTFGLSRGLALEYYHGNHPDFPRDGLKHSLFTITVRVCERSIPVSFSFFTHDIEPEDAGIQRRAR